MSTVISKIQSSAPSSSSKTSKKPPRKPRLAWIDLFETLAIFSVVFYHATSSIATLDFPDTSSPHFFIYYFFRSILATCVPIFFFANGFLLFRKSSFSLKSHLLKTARFAILAIVWYVITLALLVFLHRQELNFADPASILPAVKAGVNHLWYLGALVCIYLLYPLLKITYDHHKTAFLYFTILCCVLTFGNSFINELLTIFSRLVLHRETFYIDTNFFSIFNPLRGVYAFSFAYFCLGGVAAQYLSRLMSIPAKTRNIFASTTLIISWFLLFALGIIYSTASGKIWDNVWFGYDTVFTLVATFAIFLLCQNWTLENPIILTISKNTLGIYLVHTILIAAVAYLIPIKLITDFTSPFLLIANIIYAIFILGLSLFISLLLRRLPILKHLVS